MFLFFNTSTSWNSFFHERGGFNSVLFCFHKTLPHRPLLAFSHIEREHYIHPSSWRAPRWSNFRVESRNWEYPSHFFPFTPSRISPPSHNHPINTSLWNINILQTHNTPHPVLPQPRQWQQTTTWKSIILLFWQKKKTTSTKIVMMWIFIPSIWCSRCAIRIQ